jgi:hypothetical protein
MYDNKNNYRCTCGIIIEATLQGKKALYLVKEHIEDTHEFHRTDDTYRKIQQSRFIGAKNYSKI